MSDMTEQPTDSPLIRAATLIENLQHELNQMTADRDYWKARAQGGNHARHNV